MANQEHLDILKQGAVAWTLWRHMNSKIQPDLSKANFYGNESLHAIDLSYANLSETNLISAYLYGANLAGSDLRNAYLSQANLSGANLSGALLVQTNLTNANLTGCRIYGISAWDVHLEDAIQKDLIITPLEELLLPTPTLYPSPTLYPGKSEITIDNLEMAQFINLLLNNQKIREVINTITSKVVLILGRFTDERKAVLDALRNELRNYNFSPVVFDFDPLAKRDLTETITILAHMSRFVIADLTDAKSIPQELQAIVPHLPSVPVQPILHVDAKEYAMFEHYEQYPWVLPIYRYQNIPTMLNSLKEHIIKPVEQKEYEKGKMQALEEKVRMLEKKIRESERHS
jgi:Pentapeptide repeats (8 copies)